MITWSTVSPKARLSAGELVMENYCEGSCLSSDTKPTEDIANGSILMEMDTSSLYKFDADNQQWRKW